MKTLYLDQNMWIDLAKRKKKSDGKDPLYQAVVKAADTGEVRIPVSVIHVMETMNRTNKKSRADVLDVMIELSKGFSLLSFNDVECAEVVNAFARYHAVEKVTDIDAIQPYPFYAMGGVPTLSGIDHLPPHIQDELHAILALCATDPKLFYGIIALTDSPALHQSDRDDEKDYLKTMADRRKSVLGVPQEYRYRKYLIENIMDILRRYYPRLCSYFGVTSKSLLPADVLSNEEKTMEFLESIPTVDVRTKLNYDLLVDKSYSFHGHDFFDILFLATAIPYCDVVVTERTWRHRIKKMHLDEKYNTAVFSSLENIPLE